MKEGGGENRAEVCRPWLGIYESLAHKSSLMSDPKIFLWNRRRSGRYLNRAIARSVECRIQDLTPIADPWRDAIICLAMSSALLDEEGIDHCVGA